jgi:pimeloyl-ACP methyl ester carboxylesterase
MGSSTVLRTSTSRGLEMVADVQGNPDDPSVLLFHGGGQTRHAWGGALSALADRGWYAASFDLPGHGDSGWEPSGNYDLDTFARAVADVSNQFTEPVLVGASLGGLSSLIAVGERYVPEAAALVLVDVTPRLETAGVTRIGNFMRLGIDGFDSLEAVADAVASYLPNRKRPRDLNGLRKNVRQREDGKWVWHWDPRFFARIDTEATPTPSGEPTAGRFTPPERLHEASRKVTVPTLLVRGGSSDVVSAEGAAELKQLIPHAEIVDVADAGHMVAGDRNDRFNDAVIEFLERVVRGGG